MRLGRLNAGMRVLFCPNGRGHDMGKALLATVITRGSQAVGGQCPTVIHVDAYAGIHGPHDQGAVSLSAYQVRCLLWPMPATRKADA